MTDGTRSPLRSVSVNRRVSGYAPLVLTILTLSAPNPSPAIELSLKPRWMS